MHKCVYGLSPYNKGRKMLKIRLFKTREARKTKIYYTPGDVRLGMGLYRTPTEQEKYRQKSLKRKLP